MRTWIIPGSMLLKYLLYSSRYTCTGIAIPVPVLQQQLLECTRVPVACYCNTIACYWSDTCPYCNTRVHVYEQVHVKHCYCNTGSMLHTTYMYQASNGEYKKQCFLDYPLHVQYYLTRVYSIPGYSSTGIAIKIKIYGHIYVSKFSVAPIAILATYSRQLLACYLYKIICCLEIFGTFSAVCYCNTILQFCNFVQ